jgi:hypothetical protein
MSKLNITDGDSQYFIEKALSRKDETIEYTSNRKKGIDEFHFISP